MQRRVQYFLLALLGTTMFARTAHSSEAMDIQVTSGENTSSRHLNYYAPSGLNHPPMVIAMHGSGGNGDNLAEGMGWDVIADREKVLVVTPSGNGGNWTIWGDDDVDFVKAIINKMADQFDIDRNRVYATGWSMGGMMSYYLACHAPEVIAAIGPSSGYLMYGQSGCSSAHNVSIYHIHGQWDDFVKYSELHDYLNNNWINAFGCPTTADTSDAGTSATTLREWWGPCHADGKTSEIYLETAWKSHSYNNEETEVFWNFFKNYTLTDTRPGVGIYQHGDFKGRMNRLVEGSYPHAQLNAVGIPDGVISGIRVDSGLTVEFFSDDNFQTSLASYGNDVGDLSAINAKIRSLRISGGSSSSSSSASSSAAGTGDAGASAGSSDCVRDDQNAYLGTPAKIPGTIEAEDFDPSGYYDTTVGNEGGAYRTDVNVDVKPLGNGYAVGWMNAGEWLQYTVNVATEGEYRLNLKVGAVEAGRTVALDVCGVPLGTVQIPQVSDWGEIGSASIPSVHLAAGLQVIRVTVGSNDYLDFDSMTFELLSSSSSSSSAGGSSSASGHDAGGTGGLGGGTSGSGGTNGACSCQVIGRNGDSMFLFGPALLGWLLLGVRRRTKQAL